MNHDPLSDRLREWALPPPAFDPAFAARVQTRLHAGPSTGWSGAFRLTAAACVLLGVGMGVAGGLRAPAGHSNEQLAAAYARSIDPLLMTADARGGHAHP